AQELRALAGGDDPAPGHLAGLSQSVQASSELLDTRMEGAPSAPRDDAEAPDDAQCGQEKPTHASSPRAGTSGAARHPGPDATLAHDVGAVNHIDGISYSPLFPPRLDRKRSPEMTAPRSNAFAVSYRDR